VEECVNSIGHCITITILAFSTALLRTILQFLGQWSRMNERNDFDKKTCTLVVNCVTLALLVGNLSNFYQNCIVHTVDQPGQYAKAKAGFFFALSATLLFFPVALIEIAIPGGSRAAHDYIPDPPVPPGENAATAEDSVLTRANFGAHGIRSRFELDAFLNTRGTLGAGGGSTSIEESEEQAPPSDPKVVAHEHGVMTVLLVRGRGLRGGDGRGHSNSYVKLIVGSKFQRSKTKFRTLNPEWDSYFRFDGVLGTLAHSGLRLEVYDHEPVSGRHDSLGSATVALDGLEYRKPLLLYAPLSVQGDLQVRINWTPERQKEVALNCQEMAEQLGRTAAITHAAYYACRDLGRVAKMLGQNAHVALVSWGRFLGNPVATTIPVAPVYTQEYYVVAWNGPSIGEPSTDTTQARELYRIHQAGMLAGHVRVWPKGGDHWMKVADVVAQIEQHERQSVAPGRGTLSMHVRHVVDPAGCQHHLSHPYVVLVAGNETRTTKKSRRTLCPEWNQKFEVEGVLGEFVTSGLLVKCYNSACGFGIGPFDELLGSVTVGLDPLLTHQKVDGFVPLNVQGHAEKRLLHLAVSWIPEHKTGPVDLLKDFAAEAGYLAADVAHVAAAKLQAVARGRAIRRDVTAEQACGEPTADDAAGVAPPRPNQTAGHELSQTTCPTRVSTV